MAKLRDLWAQNEPPREPRTAKTPATNNQPRRAPANNCTTSRRFWRANVSLKNPVWFTDEEMAMLAGKLGWEKTDQVEPAKVMNMISEYFVTDATGEPIVENGKWVAAPIPAEPVNDNAPAQPAT